MTERYEWIDNARVIAALLIMYVHLPNYLTLPAPINHSCLVSVASNLAFSGRIPFFLILAGYFLARNISWKKAWNRFLWLFIPYALWNLIASGIYDWVGFERLHEMGAMSPGKFSWLGIGSIFSSQL
jgi:fucose 4-O-acetylase-like acetyltransferase